MYREKTIGKIKRAIKRLPERDKVELFNMYCEQNNFDDYIDSMEEMDNYLRGQYDIVEAIRELHNVNFDDEYMSYDDYGQPYTLSKAEDHGAWDLDKMANFMLDSGIETWGEEIDDLIWKYKKYLELMEDEEESEDEQ